MKIVATSSINSDAAKVKKKIDEFSNDISQIQDVINIIPQAWQGKDATSFINKYNEALVKLKKYEVSFNDYYKYLCKVYDIFNALEEAYNRPIDTD